MITFKAEKSLYGALADLKDDEEAREKLKKEMEAAGRNQKCSPRV